jgi:hypothetical protein
MARKRASVMPRERCQGNETGAGDAVKRAALVVSGKTIVGPGQPELPPALSEQQPPLTPHDPTPVPSGQALANLSLRTAADVAPQSVRWLWNGHLPLGKIAVVAGASDAGKSLLVAGDFAARVSNGLPWPDGSLCAAGDVLIVGGHDSPADTLVPRLCDHGADLQRVHFLDSMPDGGDSATARPPSLCDLLERGLRERPRVKMVVIDSPWALLDRPICASRLWQPRWEPCPQRPGR